MSEHRIRLRGPWEAVDLDAPSSEPFRLSMPLEGLEGGSPRRLRLVRKFGRPRSIGTGEPGGTEPLRLVLEDVQGLKTLVLNDEPLRWRISDCGGLIVDLPPLRERNTLRLEADVEPSAVGVATPWGNVAIVISERS